MKGLFKWFLVGILSIVLVSCRSIKESQTDTNIVKDSINTEYVEKIVYIPTTTYVEIPVELKQVETKDSTSILETGFALSQATLKWLKGTPILFHSLENKAQRIVKNDSVPVKEKIITKYITKTQYKEKTVYKEKQLSKWEKIKMSIGGWAIGCFIFLSLVFIFLIIRRVRLVNF